MRNPQIWSRIRNHQASQPSPTHWGPGNCRPSRLAGACGSRHCQQRSRAWSRPGPSIECPAPARQSLWKRNRQQGQSPNSGVHGCLAGHLHTRPRPQPGALQPPCACRIAAVSRRQKRELRARAHGKGKGKSSCNVTGSELRGIMEAGAASGRSSIALSFSTGACVRSSCSDEKHDGGSTPWRCGAASGTVRWHGHQDRPLARITSAGGSAQLRTRRGTPDGGRAREVGRRSRRTEREFDRCGSPGRAELLMRQARLPWSRCRVGPSTRDTFFLTAEDLCFRDVHRTPDAAVSGSGVEGEGDRELHRLPLLALACTNSLFCYAIHSIWGCLDSLVRSYRILHMHRLPSTDL